MRLDRRFVVGAAAAALLAGCSGGGTTPAAPAVSSALAPALPIAGAAGTPTVTASLTIKFPVNFHTAKISAQASAKGREPAYVNPGITNYLDVFDVEEANGSYTFFHPIPLTSGSPNVVNSSAGTQTFTFPLYSGVVHDIVAIETDTGLPNGNILAIGETDLPSGSVTPGSGPAIGLTMLMNVDYLGLMTSPSDANGDASTVSPYITCYSLVYPFAADAEGGFASNAGLGTVIPILTNWKNDPNTSPPDTVAPGGTGQNAGYAITFNTFTSGTGVTLSLAAVNPALAIVQDLNATSSNPGSGQYPGIEQLYDVDHAFGIGTINGNAVVTQSMDVQTLGC